MRILIAAIVIFLASCSGKKNTVFEVTYMGVSTRNANGSWPDFKPLEQPTEKAIVFNMKEKTIILRSARPSILTIIDMFDTPPTKANSFYSTTYSCRDELKRDCAVSAVRENSSKDSKITAVLVMYPLLSAYYRGYVTEK